jgi:hypothetical protein
MAEFQHKALADGKWFEMTLCAQMGNIGSEISRAVKWQHKNPAIYESCIYRAIELLDLTLSDPRLRYRCKEIARAKEVVCDAWFGGKEYNSTLESLEKYFNQFALAARLGN